MSPFQRKLLAILIVMAVISPIGVYLPARFNAGDAWGEWSTETIEKMIGFVPVKLKETADLWKAPIPDYNLGDEKSGFAIQALSYVLSGVFGILLCVLVLFGISKLLVKK
ncbi:MAG: cobalamin biosynthesis protein [Spirochaetes bacterium]|nr:cobalamin biosynthesis protein [Spirochaetota bacterium]